MYVKKRWFKEKETMYSKYIISSKINYFYQLKHELFLSIKI
jgi:hypothetical protein